MGRCISETDIAHLLRKLCRIYEKIGKFRHITIRALQCILKGFLLFLNIFQRYLVPNIDWLQKQFSYENETKLWPLEISASLAESRTTRYPYGTYLKILTENLSEKKI